MVKRECFGREDDRTLHANRRFSRLRRGSARTWSRLVDATVGENITHESALLDPVATECVPRRTCIMEKYANQLSVYYYRHKRDTEAIIHQAKMDEGGVELAATINKQHLPWTLGCSSLVGTRRTAALASDVVTFSRVKK